MNAALRQTIRLALDQRTRQEALRPPGTPGFCSGCGMPCDTQTPDCSTCSDRHRGRDPERRAAKQAWHAHKLATDPAYRERRKEINNDRKRRDRAAARERQAAA